MNFSFPHMLTFKQVPPGGRVSPAVAISDLQLLPRILMRMLRASRLIRWWGGGRISIMSIVVGRRRVTGCCIRRMGWSVGAFIIARGRCRVGLRLREGMVVALERRDRMRWRVGESVWFPSELGKIRSLSKLNWRWGIYTQCSIEFIRYYCSILDCVPDSFLVALISFCLSKLE